MSDIIFVLKTLAITVALVIVMQVRVGRATIEQHSLAWIQQSTIVENLRAVAAGAVKAVSKGSSFVTSSIDPHAGAELVGRKSSKKDSFWEQEDTGPEGH